MLIRYLVLFSPAYPLAPLLALVNNILEMRVDATKLCRDVRRPHWELAEDIGSWSVVLSILGFIAVITNASMITFVGKKISEVCNACVLNLSTSGDVVQHSAPP